MFDGVVNCNSNVIEFTFGYIYSFKFYKQIDNMYTIKHVDIVTMHVKLLMLETYKKVKGESDMSVMTVKMLKLIDVNLRKRNR